VVISEDRGVLSLGSLEFARPVVPPKCVGEERDGGFVRFPRARDARDSLLVLAVRRAELRKPGVDCCEAMAGAFKVQVQDLVGEDAG
jgi:hypothetical protein